MESTEVNTTPNSERKPSNVFSLAVAVGLIVFFVTGELEGGLSGVEGFFGGLSAILLLFIVVLLLGKHRTQASEKYKTLLSMPGNVSISQTESENGVTIQIFVSKSPSSSSEMNND